MRGHVLKSADVFTLLRQMAEDIDTRLALTQPEGSDWREDIAKE